MDNSSIGAVLGGLSIAGIDTPKSVVDAEKISAEAAAVLASVNAETEPTVILEVGKIRKSIDALVAYRQGRADRLALAQSAASDAAARERGSWQAALPEMHDQFRAAFDGAAKRFEDALTALGGNTDPAAATVSSEAAEQYRDMARAASDLAQLAAIRDVYANFAWEKGQAISDPEERLTRTLVLPNREAAPRRIDHRSGHYDRTPEGFKALLRLGVKIKWQDAAEQTANSLAIHSAPAA